MSVVETTEDTTFAQVQQQYDSVSREKETCKAVVGNERQQCLYKWCLVIFGDKVSSREWVGDDLGRGQVPEGTWL